MEMKWIDWLRSQVAASPHVELGIGDDAAVVRLPAASRLVVSTDLLMDGVHFELARIDARRAGRKCLAVNLSDLAAMAARPLAAFIAVALPRDLGLQLGKSLYEGLLPLAEQFEIAISGGDTNTWRESLVVSVTVLGLATERGPLLRSGAVPGDAILATGSFGGSLLGHHLDFTPRLREALALHQRYDLHAAIDVSDGLALDVSRIAQSSKCGACLDLSAVPIAPAAQELAAQDGRSPLEHALGDGEDFELILAAPPDVAQRILADRPLDIPLAQIGTFVADRGLWQETPSGRRALPPSGFQHT